MEQRVMETLEARELPENDKRMVIEGYALKFNTWSENLGGFIETISPEALQDTDLSDVRCLIDHDSSKILGRTTSGTLKLNVDSTGLWYECTLPETTLARDLYENIRLGNINQCSFGFTLPESGDEWRRDEQSGLYRRTINAFESLTDVSAVTYPAYKDTMVAPALRTIQDMERSLEREKLKVELQLL